MNHLETANLVSPGNSIWNRRQWLFALSGLFVIVGVALVLRIIFFVGCQGSDDLATWQMATVLSQGDLKPVQILQNPIASLRYGSVIPTAVIFVLFGNSEKTLMVYPVVVSLLGLVAVWDLVRRMTGNVWAAHFAGVVMALMSLDIHYSTVSLPDGPMTSVSLLSIWCAVVATGDQWQQRLWTSRILLVCCGLLAGFAYLHKVPGGAQLVLGLGLWGILLILSKNYRHGLWLVPLGFLVVFLGEHLFFLLVYDDVFHRWNTIVESSAQNAARRQEIATSAVAYDERLKQFADLILDYFPSMTLLIVGAALTSLVALLRDWRHRSVALISCYTLSVLAMRFLELSQTYSFQPRRMLPFGGCAALLIGFGLWRNHSLRGLMIASGAIFLIAQGTMLLTKDLDFTKAERQRLNAERWLYRWMTSHSDSVDENGLYIDVRTAKIIHAFSGFTSLDVMNTHPYASGSGERNSYFGDRPESYESGAYFFENMRYLDWLLPFTHRDDVFEIYRELPESWTLQGIVIHPSSSSHNAALYRIGIDPVRDDPPITAHVMVFNCAKGATEERDSSVDATHQFDWRFEGLTKLDRIECEPLEITGTSALSVRLEGGRERVPFRMNSGDGKYWDPPRADEFPVQAGQALRLLWRIKIDRESRERDWVEGRIRIRGFDETGAYHDLYDRKLRLYYDEQQVRGYAVAPCDLTGIRIRLELKDGGRFTLHPPVLERYEELKY